MYLTRIVDNRLVELLNQNLVAILMEKGYREIRKGPSSERFSKLNAGKFNLLVPGCWENCSYATLITNMSPNRLSLFEKSTGIPPASTITPTRKTWVLTPDFLEI